MSLIKALDPNELDAWDEETSDDVTDEEFKEIMDDILKEFEEEISRTYHEILDNEDQYPELAEIDNAKTIGERIEVLRKYHPEMFDGDIIILH